MPPSVVLVLRVMTVAGAEVRDGQLQVTADRPDRRAAVPPSAAVADAGPDRLPGGWLVGGG